MIRCTVGVMAYNEEDSIVPVLNALLDQRTFNCEIEEIIVVASGCTDRTVERAQVIADRYPIISIDQEPIRSGKAAAVNRLIAMAQHEVVVLVGADTLPDPNAIEQLVSPFADPQIGMTGARVVPLNSTHSFLGWTIQLLWHLHHQLAMQCPKLGELVAFRNVVDVIPPETATDEVALEMALTERGYKLAYVPNAVVYNYGPEDLDDFLSQRRRIFAGHLHIAQELGYRPVSMKNGWLLKLCIAMMLQHPLLIIKLCCAMALEGYARILGTLDHLSGHNHRVWKQVRSSKQVQREGQNLRLVRVNCRDSISAGELLRRAGSLPADLGGLIWWDAPLSEAIFALPVSEQYSVEEQIVALAEYFGPRSRMMIAYRMVEFRVWTAGEYVPVLEERALCVAA